jgi:hypothetical protein
MVLKTKVIELDRIYQMFPPKKEPEGKKIERIVRKLAEKNLEKGYDVVIFLPPSWSIDLVEIFAKEEIIEKIAKLLDRCGLEYEILKVKDEIEKMFVDLDIESLKYLLKDID